ADTDPNPVWQFVPSHGAEDHPVLHHFAENPIFVPSYANFVLVKVGDGDRVFSEMMKHGVILRAMRGYKLPDWVRISIGKPEQNARCIEILEQVLE
ncbi:MAG: hypothetical protein AAGH89_05050, partial [Verrucomicrobiota bacterium]